jgi:hypothetical protein
MANRHWGRTSGDWTNSADWTGAKAPGVADAATIDAPGTYTVTVTGPETVGSVRLDDAGATLDITGTGTLSVSGATVVQSGTLEIDPSGMLENGGTLTVKSGGTLNLNGTMQGGTLVVDHGGTLEASTLFFGTFPSTLENVTVLGGLTLNSGFFKLSGSTSVENANGTGPGVITVGATASLSLNEVSYKVVLNGGYITKADVTIDAGASVSGYGAFYEGQVSVTTVENEGTINANVNGQWLYIGESSGGLGSFVNDGLVLASHGGNLSVDYGDVDSTPWTNKADGVIRVIDGGTLQLGAHATNLGLITSVDSDIYFGDSSFEGGDSVTNAGQINVKGGEFFLGVLGSPRSNSWTDSGSIKTVSAATDIQGNGVISAGGTFDINGGTVTGSGQVEDGGTITLEGGTVTLASLSIDSGATLSGFGTVTDPLTNSGTITAEHGKLDLEAGVSGSGQLDIGKRATLELGGPTSEAVTFDGKHGTLLFDLTNDFSGTVAGMAGHDNVDLANFAFSGDPLVTSVSGTGAAGTTTDVTIQDGSLTTTLHLLNQYTSQFAVSASAYTLTSDHTGSDPGTLLAVAHTPNSHTI